MHMHSNHTTDAQQSTRMHGKSINCSQIVHDCTVMHGYAWSYLLMPQQKFCALNCSVDKFIPLFKVDKRALPSNRTTVRAINLHFYAFTTGGRGCEIIIIQCFKLEPFAIFIALMLNGESFKCGVNISLPK